MDDPKPSVIIKAFADPDEKEGIEFFYTLGACVSRWAFVDRQLYRLSRFALKLDAGQASFVYYRHRGGFNQRLSFADESLKTILPKDQFQSEWRPLYNNARTLASTRNIFAHQPAKRLGTSKDGKAVYIYSIHIEPFERVLDRDYHGLQGKDELEIDDLKQHGLAVDELERELRAFHQKLVMPRD